MASGASFLGEASFPTASVTGGATVHGPLPTRSGSSRGRRGGRIHSGPRSAHDTQEQAWGTSVQRVALPGSGRGGACVGGGVYVRPGPGAGVATALHQNEHLQGGLSAEFCGRRSTRLVSKFHHGRQKLYLGKHSTEADAALQEVFSLPSSAGTGPLLNRWCHKLVGLEDFPYMLRELGNKGEWEKALKSFDWMVSQQSIRGEWSKLASIMISTLGRLGKVDLAQKVFDKAVAAGFGKNVYAFSALVSAYGRSGRCREALDVFQAMKKAGCPPNLITYNSIIDACGKGGVDLNKALEIFDEMQREGVEPDRITFNSLIAVCSRGSLWEESQRVFAEMQRRGIEQDIFTYNTLVDAVCKGGQMDIAASIVATMRQKGIMPNVVTYSTMIDGYGKIGCFDEAIRVYHEMKDAGIRPDRVSYNTLLDIYAKLGMFEEALTICKEMERAGWKTDVVTYNALIDAYGKQGKYREAASLFSRMKDEGLVPNVLTYSALIYAFSKGGLHQEARQVFEEFRDAGLKPDVVLYSALIDAFCKSGLVEEAVQLLEEMMAEGIQPNIVTYNSLIDAYGRRGQVDYALSTMERMKGVGIVPDCRTYNSVIYAFGNECRGEQPLQTPEQVRARSVEFDIPPVPRPLDAQGGQGDILAAVRVFHEMQELGVKPNVVTFSAILNACSRCASFEEASLLLEEMRLFDSRVYGVAHGLLMGMREQVWQEAEALFDQMFFMDLATAGAFYNALTDVLWHFGQREGAQKVVIAAKRRQVWANAWWRSEQQFCLDLHLMSVGAAQAMLHVWLLHIRGLLYEGHELPRLLSILTGWGKHSKVAGDSSVKRAVEAHLVDIGAPFHVARHNEGRLVSAGHVVGAWLREGRTEQLLRLRDQVCRVNNRRDSMSDPRLILATR